MGQLQYLRQSGTLQRRALIKEDQGKRVAWGDRGKIFFSARQIKADKMIELGRPANDTAYVVQTTRFYGVQSTDRIRWEVEGKTQFLYATGKPNVIKGVLVEFPANLGVE